MSLINSCNNSIEFSSENSTYSKDSEQSLLEIFSMDVSQDLENLNKPVKNFTAWTDMLLNEKKKKEYEIKIGLSMINHKIIKDEKLRKQNELKLKNFSNDIAHCLKEKRKDIVFKIVQTCGFDKSSELCAEAQEIFKTTGMLTAEGKARTLGGIFFQLVKLKTNLNDLQKKEIFSEASSNLSKKKKKIKNAKKRLKKQLKNEEKLEKKFSALGLS